MATPDNATPTLAVAGLSAGYQGRPVIFDVDLEVHAGEVVAIFGSNGAGKTTTLKAILGLVAPLHGSITYENRPWDTRRPYRAPSAGISYVAAERFVFPGLKVSDNLRLASRNVPSARRHERLDEVLEMFPKLASRSHQLAGTMSGGEQRMLSLAVAFMSEPRLLLIDEPSLGLAPTVVEQILDTVQRRARTSGTAVLIVEQNVGHALRVVDRGYVMRSGRTILHQPASVLRELDNWWDLY